MKKLLESYWQMPRAGKWGVWFAVVMVLYFGAIEPYINFMNSVTVEADRIEAGGATIVHLQLRSVLSLL